MSTRNIIFGFLAALFLVWSFLPTTMAQTNPPEDFCSGVGAGTQYCQQVSSAPSNPVFGKDGILAKVINFISFLVGIVSIFMLIIGGYKFAFSGGSPESVSSGRNMIIYALVGIAVVAVAQAIVALVLNRLGSS